MNVRRLSLAFAALLVLVAVAVPPAGAGPLVDRAVEELASDPVYVDPSAERAISDAEAARLRDRIGEADAGPTYIAILPAVAAREAGGDASGVLVSIRRALDRPGTYAVVVGDAFRAGSDFLPRGEASELADRAFAEHRSEGVAATLLAFVDAVGAERGGGSDEGGDGSGAGAVIVPILAVGGIGFWLFRRRRRRQVEDAELAEVKEAAQEDLLALADGVRALDLDVQMPNASEEARADYERALRMYERADRDLDRARRPEDLESVSAATEEGRFAIASSKARLEGR